MSNLACIEVNAGAPMTVASRAAVKGGHNSGAGGDGRVDATEAGNCARRPGLGDLPIGRRFSFMQGGAAAARETHNLEVVGASPAPATNFIPGAHTARHLQPEPLLAAAGAPPFLPPKVPNGGATFFDQLLVGRHRFPESAGTGAATPKRRPDTFSLRRYVCQDSARDDAYAFIRLLQLAALHASQFARSISPCPRTRSAEKFTVNIR